MAKRTKTNYIVVHCSATKEHQPFDVKDIDRMHRARGFSKIGYHFLVLLDGTVQPGRDQDEVGAHVSGKNSESIGVCYVGGLDRDGKAKDTRTIAQKETLRELLTTLKIDYPHAKIVGHRDLSPDRNGDGIISPYERIKECPCFDAIPEYADIKPLPPTPPDKPLHSARVYVVEPGDTLYAIARKFNITVDELAAINEINPNVPLQVGQEIREAA